jgi:hypothetical protein
MELWKSLAHLYPESVSLRDYAIADDGDGPYIAAWHLETPQPTEEQLAVAITAYDAAREAAQTEASALRTRVVNLAQSAVGVQIDLLTAAQRNALLAVLLWKAGGIRPDGSVAPLNDWVR